MRLVILVALALALGGAAIAVVPAASACSSDPDAVCILINYVGECAGDLNHKTIVERCT